MRRAKGHWKARGARCVMGCEGLWEHKGDVVRDGVRGVMGRRMG
jgi:hypothetical protein